MKDDIKFLLMYNIMGKYQLVNPVIIGTFANTYNAKNSDDAAKQFWENLTSDNKYVTGNIPKFLFTLKEEGSNQLHHYMVKEKLEGRITDYSISNVDSKLDANSTKTFLSKSDEVRKNVEQLMSGGRRRKSHDDSSSSDSDLDDMFEHVRLKRLSKPIVYWWYNPSIYNVDYVFTPSFVSPISPYVQLWIPN